jgi:large subunit ribosomal protein L17
MRHNVKTKRLSRDSEHKKALKRNLAAQLILHEELETTHTKAKYLRPYIERLITRAKNKSGSALEKFNTVKYLRGKLYSEEAIKKLVDELGTRYKNRAGGYTRIVKTRNRDGDKALMSRIELVKERKKKEPEAVTETKDDTAVKKAGGKPPKKKAGTKAAKGAKAKTAKTKVKTKAKEAEENSDAK